VLAEQGRAFNTPPGPASISAQVRSIADRNEALGLPAVADPGPVYVTKEEASEAQALESRLTGGMVPRGSLAAQMQGGSSHTFERSPTDRRDRVRPIKEIRPDETVSILRNNCKLELMDSFSFFDVGLSLRSDGTKNVCVRALCNKL
jgi:hypothetical protein